ncbi:MAG: hypothetical protein ACLPY5_01440 [Candidatus Bathyarchaeia archaeon]
MALYRHGVPWRRIKEIIEFLILLAVTVSIGLFVLANLTQLLNFLKNSVRGVISDLIFLGRKLGLVGTDFATYASAQVLADFISAVIFFVGTVILGYIFLGKIRQGLQFPTHDIKIVGSQPSHTESDGVTTYYVRISNENGDEPALNCRARIKFTGITRRDMVDIPNNCARYFSSSDQLRETNYFTTTEISFQLPWLESILSGDFQLLPVLKYFPAMRGMPEHFEVPRLADPEPPFSGVGVCLKPLHYYGEIRIIPERGRYRSENFSITGRRGRDWTVKT